MRRDAQETLDRVGHKGARERDREKGSADRRGEMRGRRGGERRPASPEPDDANRRFVERDGETGA